MKRRSLVILLAVSLSALVVSACQMVAEEDVAMEEEEVGLDSEQPEVEEELEEPGVDAPAVPQPEGAFEAQFTCGAWYCASGKARQRRCKTSYGDVFYQNYYCRGNTQCHGGQCRPG
jgi:hypothetical protein